MSLRFKQARRSLSTIRRSRLLPGERSMRRLGPALLIATVMLPVSSAFGWDSAKGVKVITSEAQRRVDVTIDGTPFTSYVWPTTLKKPTLFPLITSDGVTVTRGFPLDPKPGERVDHPH